MLLWSVSKIYGREDVNTCLAPLLESWDIFSSTLGNGEVGIIGSVLGVDFLHGALGFKAFTVDGAVEVISGPNVAFWDASSRME